MIPDYCRGASAAFICYDITRFPTFEEIPHWIATVRNAIGEIPIFLLGCNYEQEMRFHEVSDELAENFARETMCVRNIMVSSRNGMNMEESMHSLAEYLIEHTQ
jgi:GTPase SAR1 family protein